MLLKDQTNHNDDNYHQLQLGSVQLERSEKSDGGEWQEEDGIVRFELEHIFASVFVSVFVSVFGFVFKLALVSVFLSVFDIVSVQVHIDFPSQLGTGEDFKASLTLKLMPKYFDQKQNPAFHESI